MATKNKPLLASRYYCRFPQDYRVLATPPPLYVDIKTQHLTDFDGPRNDPVYHKDASFRWPLSLIFDQSQNNKPPLLLDNINTDGEKSDELIRRTKTWRQARLSGWKMGILGCTLLASLTLLSNTGVIIYVIARCQRLDSFAFLYKGNCKTSSAVILWCHVAINLIGSAILSASNYCMQILSSPTRSDVDRAHSNKKSLGIGLQSMGNLRSISTKRSCMWLILALSSIPLHLLYNSLIFSMTNAYEYRFLVTRPEFLLPSDGPEFTGGAFGSEALELYRRVQNSRQSFTRLERDDCATRYSKKFITDRKDVVMVKPNLNALPSSCNAECLNNSLVYFDTLTPSRKVILPKVLGTIEIRNTKGQLVQNNLDLSYCLSEEVPENCRVLLSIPIIAVIIACNLLKTITMLVMFKERGSQEDPLVTLGDAIQSYLEKPDMTTKHKCLWDKDKFKKSESRQEALEDLTAPEKYCSRKRLWFRAGSTQRWIISNSPAILGLASLGIIFAKQPPEYDQSSAQRVFGNWNPSFVGGLPDENTVDLGTTGKSISNAIASMLVVNLPQAAFSLIYMSYNSLFTFLCGANEWSRYAYSRKTLRVTSPTGSQRSTYWLQMPYKVSLPLVFLAFIFHWLLSQCFNFQRVSVYDLNGINNPEHDISTTAYTSAPIMIVLILGGFLVLVFGTGSGLCTFKPGLPLAGACSLTISAACHSISGDPDEALKPLNWGVIYEAEPTRNRAGGEGIRSMSETMIGGDALENSRERPGHCAFSSGRVTLPIPDHFYR